MMVSHQCMETMRQCDFSPRRGWVGVGHSRHAAYFTRLVLSLARRNRWEEVGTIAYGNGDHRGVLKVAEEREEAYPRRLRIFYLGGGDFCGCHGRVGEAVAPLSAGSSCIGAAAG